MVQPLFPLMNPSQPSFSIQSTLQRLHRASNSYDGDDVVQAEILCVLVEERLETNALRLIRSAEGRPILISYQNDATSYLVRAQVNASTSLQTLQRRGRHLQ